MAESGVKIEYSDSPTRPGTSSSLERSMGYPSTTNPAEVQPDIEVGKIRLRRLAHSHPESAQGGGQPEPKRASLWTLVPEPRSPRPPMTQPQSPVYSGSYTPTTPRALTLNPESQMSPRPGPSHSPIADPLALSPVSSASTTYEYSRWDEGSTHSNVPAQEAVTSWGDVADSPVQEYLIQFPNQEFQREIQKLPPRWVREMKKKRANYNSLCHYARRKHIYATALQTTEHYAHHILRQKRVWEQAWEKSIHEMGEMRVTNARYSERIAELMRELAEVRKQVKGQEDRANLATRKLSRTIYDLGAQRMEVQRLTAENARLQVINDPFLANQGLDGENTPERRSVGEE